MTLTDEILQILHKQAVPMARKEIFDLATEAADADDVSRALYHLNKSGKIKRTSADQGGYQWQIPIGQQLKEALKPKHTPAPQPKWPPSAQAERPDEVAIHAAPPTGKLGFSIHDGGELTIYANDCERELLVLDPDETLALGDFLHLTEGLWRP